MSHQFGSVKLIVSGGQTGADRAALDWAIQHGIPHAGWCPRDRKADEAFPIDERYQLKETPSDDYAQRTEWNVRDSDGTVIFSISSHLTAGSALTETFALQYRKPYVHIHRASTRPAAMLLAFLCQYDIHVLNIAGPRASTEPEVVSLVMETLNETFIV
jgi:hypothetical protein